MWELQEGMEVRKDVHDWRDDGLLQGDLLPIAPVHATKTSEMGHQDLVHGMLYHQIYMEFFGLLWERGGQGGCGTCTLERGKIGIEGCIRFGSGYAGQRACNYHR
jgi:hypothetical protein